MIPVVEVGDSFDGPEIKEVVAPRLLEDEEALTAASDILEEVKRKGDEALLEFTKQFDQVELQRETIRVNSKEFDKAEEKVGDDFRQALGLAKERIFSFHEKQKETFWQQTKTGSITLGQFIRPIERVGAYVPGGRASYPSSVLMNVIPAKVAGVKEIALVTPPNRSGEVSPLVLVAAKEVGVDEIYKVGGAQAIAALAYGTQTIKRVDKITGPGNIYVTLAKKLVVGVVDIDMLAGPSEIVVVADNQAKASFVAADMLAQAEHDPEALAILITTSSQLADEVKTELAKQVTQLKNQETATQALTKRGKIFLVNSVDDGLKLANLIAPEHLELMVEGAQGLLDKVENAGAVFVGNYTPETLGDYLAGPNHILPTMGTARFASPLGVYDFVKYTSVLSFSREELREMGRQAEILADLEGLDAHARSVRIRTEEEKSW